nr:MAG TPA: hypothetical protein [Caudoviricetes sp.]
MEASESKSLCWLRNRWRYVNRSSRGTKARSTRTVAVLNPPHSPHG